MKFGDLLLSLLSKIGLIRIGGAGVAISKGAEPAKLDTPQVVTAGIDVAIGAPATVQSGTVTVTETPWEPSK